MYMKSAPDVRMAVSSSTNVANAPEFSRIHLLMRSDNCCRAMNNESD